MKYRFEPGPRFSVKAVSPSERKERQSSELEELKGRLLARALGAHEPALRRSLSVAAQEASAVAWVTPYPLLFFPTLLDEKIEHARVQASRQRKVWRRSRWALGALKQNAGRTS